MMNDLMLLKIELKASRIAIKRPDMNPRLAPGPQLREEDYKKAIAEEFSEANGYEDWMVDPLYKQFTEARGFHHDMEDLAKRMIHRSF